MEVRETAEAGEELLVAVGFSGSRKSKYILKWAMHKFLPEGNVVFKLLHVYPKIVAIPTPMGNWIPIQQVKEDVAAHYREETERKKKNSLLPYQQILKAKKVKADIVMLESDDVAVALSLEVAKQQIRHLVIGLSFTNIFTRKHLSLKWIMGEDLSSVISQAAPNYCSVYVIADGKLQQLRPADSEQDSITIDNSSYLSTDSSSSPSSLTIGHLLKIGPPSSSHQSSTPSDSFTFTSQHTERDKSPLKRLAKISECKQNTLLDMMADENGSFMGSITAEGSSVSTPDVLSLVGPPPATSSFLGNAPALGTPPTVSPMETPPNSSASGVPPPAEKSDELEKLKIELKRIEHRIELAEKSDTHEKFLFPLEQISGLSVLGLDDVEKPTKERPKDLASVENNQTKAEKMESRPNHLLARPVSQYQKFTWEEIVDATSSFSDEFMIGKGAFGTVYKCKLHHTTVAVKVLNAKNSCTNKQFLQELEILSTIRHPHLLLLLGAVPEESCLVYEYMEKGSLDDILFRKNNTPSIPWYDRFRICWEVAAALAFLHNTKPQPIIHRDLKPANILLDQNLVSKIGDAGLGTMISVEATDESPLQTLYKETSPVGTLCYIDPEYQRTGRVSTKSDIYALGVVILQLLTAKRAVGIAYVVEDAIDEGTLMEILDSTAGKWPEKETLEMALLGLQCAELRGRDRPDLRDKVLPVLERLKEVADRARESSSSASTAIPAHFICPILKDIMEDPYVAADGYTYDHKAIERWLKQHNTSPTTNLPLPHKFIMPNTALLEAIKIWRSERPVRR